MNSLLQSSQPVNPNANGPTTSMLGGLQQSLGVGCGGVAAPQPQYTTATNEIHSGTMTSSIAAAANQQQQHQLLQPQTLAQHKKADIQSLLAMRQELSDQLNLSYNQMAKYIDETIKYCVGIVEKYYQESENIKCINEINFYSKNNTINIQ